MSRCAGLSHSNNFQFRFLFRFQVQFLLAFLASLLITCLGTGHEANADDSVNRLWPVVVVTDDSTVVTSALARSLRQLINENASLNLRLHANDHHLKFALHTVKNSYENSSPTVRLHLEGHLVVRDRIKYRFIERPINSSVANCNLQLLYICVADIKQRLEHALQAAKESTRLIKYIENGKWE